MTMIELLVAMAIGVGVTLVVATMLVAGENHKRITTSTNDADQTGSYSFYALDRLLRSAGSAIVQSAGQGVLGCRLNAAGILPRTTALPAPFAANFLGGAPSLLRVAPVLIGAGQSDNSASDVLVVMGGSGAAGGVPRPINGSGSSTSLILESTEAFSQYDLLMVSQSGTTDCLLEEVSTVTPTSLTLSTTLPYYTTGATTTISTLASSTATYVTPLGNAAVNNLQYQLIGVGTNDTMYSYDLLENQHLVQSPGTADAVQAIADGVIQMNALYGISTAAGVFSNWANPAVSPYDINSVMANTATMKLITSIHVALVVRGEYADPNVVSPATLTVFTGLVDGSGNSLTKTVTLPDQHYRYRVFEFTVPLRNLMILAGVS